MNNKPLPTEELIERSREKHGNKYSYELMVYSKRSEKVVIICQVHGKFKQRMDSHLSGSGCPRCQRGGRGNKITIEQFKERSEKKHKGKYGYELVKHTGNFEEITIICPVHGKFKQRMDSHLAGHGCPECSHFISKPETEWLNFIEKENNIILKRQHRLGRRKFDGFHKKTNTIYEFLGGYWHGDPNVFDPKKMNKKVGRTFGTLYKRTIKKFEKLKSMGYNVVFIWENDWVKYNNWKKKETNENTNT